MRQLGGYFVYDSRDAQLLVSLLPALVHVRGSDRLSVPVLRTAGLTCYVITTDARPTSHPPL